MRFCFETKTFIENDNRPNELAVVGSDFQLTWKEFGEAVEAFSEILIENHVHLYNSPIILYGHKSANMVVAIYACMSLEIAYIPIDEIYPLDRIQKVKEIAEVKWLLNTTEKKISFEGVGEIQLQEHSYFINKGTYATPGQREKEIDPLVYLIFTSGSTGEPKGVQISTEAIQSFTRWMTLDFNFKESDVFINSAVLSFDLSVFEVMTFGALGATILLNDKESSSDPKKMINRVNQYKGSIWVSTPSFALLYSRMEADSIMPSLKCFLFCGEVLPNPLAKSLLNNFSNARVLNTYGPTEATVATTLVNISKEIIEEFDPLPVGSCKRDSELILKNGEIIIKGQNVSVGYLNRPDLNKEKFFQIDGQRAFKTGDEGTLKNGMLFFSGRNDDLVKLHGYRIELNEINSNILKLDFIENAATLALKRNGEVKKIVSLIQYKANISNRNEDLILFLKKHLPQYMIPSDFKTIEVIPLNQNGKVDKKRLIELYLQR